MGDNRNLTIPISEEMARRVDVRGRRSVGTLELQTAILADWVNGERVKDTAAKHHISVSAVQNFLKQVRAEAKRVLEHSKNSR